MSGRAGARARGAGARPALRRARLPRWLRAAPACLLALCAAADAGAQAVPQQAAADALFREARGLLQAGKVAPACAKFAESQRLDPKLGTLLNLASCHEEEGKTASAWAEFTQAVDLAVKAKQKPRADFAREHVADLEPRLSRVVFQAAAPPPAGLRIQLGDRELAGAALGSRIPLDPGKYPVQVTATGKRRWSTEVLIPPGPATVEVAIPALADEAPAGSAGDGASTQRTVGIILGGVGIVGLGVGAYFGIRAFSQQGIVEDNCEAGLCNREGFEADSDAHTSATVSTIAFAAGAALTAGGAVLFLTAGPPGGAGAAAPATGGPAALWLSPRVGSRGADLTLGGAW